MRGDVIRLPSDCSQAALLETIDQLNDNRLVHGILVQLPLPKQIDEQRVIERVSPAKDVDGFHPENAGLLSIGRPRFVPCTPLGVQTMLTSAEIVTKGLHAVVLGRSNIVGKPMALLLLQKGSGGDATVTVAHTGTKDVREVARQADLLIAAIGRAEAVTGEWIKPGAIVIDVGIHRKDNGKLCGDVRFAEAREVASWITPVPGGVGKMTIAMLLKNTLLAASLAHS
jgi:methylenetetrahydrofolate dehydrogenase (NADP+)/methenyltetrahydrofolate cyclohydrolase